MLSSPISNPPPSALQTRQRLHRRQRSTPAAIATKMPAGGLPTPATRTATAAAISAATAAIQAHTPSQQPRQQPLARQSSHRRGQSLDTRRQQLLQRHERQQQQRLMAAAVAAGNGSLEQDLQNMHAMREMQQQRTERPGSTHNVQPSARQSRKEDAFLASERQNQQQQQQQQQRQDETNAAFDFYPEPTATIMRKSLSGSGYPTKQQDFQLFDSSYHDGFQPSHTTLQDPSITAAFATMSAMSPDWLSEDEGNTSSTQRTIRRVSNGIMDRVARFESLAEETMSGPATPPRQNNNAYFPPTPTETPQEQFVKLDRKAQLSRFSDEYDGSMEETLKPLRNRGSQSNRSSGIFEDMRQQAEAAAASMATPPRSNMLHMPVTPVDFMNMNMNMSQVDAYLASTSYAANMAIPATMQHLSPPLSQLSTPANVQGVFDSSALGSDTLVGNPDLFNKTDSQKTGYSAQQTMSPFDAALVHSPSFSKSLGSFDHRSSHRRNESLASVTSVDSMASMGSMTSSESIGDMNLGEARTDTGVTLDDIATYIDGPSPTDGKWRCTFDGCNKRFGRKENIKSHIQTHLNDRQFQCPHCQKCFVRQHDLKRHAKIHSGVKPYPCECGNNFARHDALTRHRQRGMCIGAFDGAVRKVGKRGRPRKNRPDMDERREKSSRTRSKNQASTSPREWPHSSPESYVHSAYGHSESSDTSASNSPRSDHSDNLFDSESFRAMGNSNLLDLDLRVTSSAMPVSHSTNSGTMNPSALIVSSAPMPGAGMSAAAMTKREPTVSPSPSALSHASPMSSAPLSSYGREAVGDEGAAEAADVGHFLPAKYESPAESVSSHYSHHHPSTPPELSASSSPPQSSATHYFDIDEEDSLDLSAPLSSRCGPLGGMDAEDMLLMKALATDDVLVQLDNSGLSMLNTSRFDDDYSMFSSSDDVLFGN